MLERPLVALQDSPNPFANNIGIRVIWCHSEFRPEKEAFSVSRLLKGSACKINVLCA
jgi:hypothetical protein